MGNFTAAHPFQTADLKKRCDVSALHKKTGPLFVTLTPRLCPHKQLPEHSKNGSLAGAIPVCAMLFYLATFWSKFAMMLYKYARFKGYDLTATGDLTRFPDAGSISSWAETALSWANGKGLINGHENGTIDPKGSTIRAQAASIMANFDQNVAK